MASGQFPSAHFGGVPFIQSSPMILNGPAGLGLEGVGFSGAAMEMALMGVGGARAAIGASQQQQQQQQVGKSLNGAFWSNNQASDVLVRRVVGTPDSICIYAIMKDRSVPSTKRKG